MLAATTYNQKDEKLGGVIENKPPDGPNGGSVQPAITVMYRPDAEEIGPADRRVAMCFTNWACEPRITLDPSGAKMQYSGEPIFNKEKMTYLVYQVELSSEGKPHWQGYVEFTKLTFFKAAAEFLGIYADHKFRLMHRKGTAKQASEYCTPNAKKDGKIKEGIIPGTCKEWGTLSNQGGRSDIKEILLSVKQGIDKEKLIEDVGIERFARIRNTIADLSTSAAKKRAIAIRPHVETIVINSEPDFENYTKRRDKLGGKYFVKRGENIGFKTTFDGYNDGDVLIVYSNEVEEKWINSLKNNELCWLNIKYGGTWLTGNVWLIIDHRKLGLFDEIDDGNGFMLVGRGEGKFKYD